ncbi:type IV secretion system protein [Candidatus Orientia mediorientalis]|nr:type IV secretion system protein [Candidatus Orientia mediorientalis]
MLCLVIILPSVAYGEKDCCIFYPRKFKCCTYDHQFCYPLVQSKCIEKEELRYQNPDHLQQRIQSLESYINDAWSNIQNDQFSSNLEKLNTLTEVGDKGRQIVSLVEQFKLAMVNESKIRNNYLKNALKPKEYSKLVAQLVEKKQAALKLVQESGENARSKFLTTKFKSRDLVVDVGVKFIDSFLIYQKINTEIDSKESNRIDQESILNLKKQAISKTEEIFNASTELRSVCQVFISWLFGRSKSHEIKTCLTEEKENQLISFLSGQQSQNVIPTEYQSYIKKFNRILIERSNIELKEQLKSKMEGVIKICKNYNEFVNGLKLQKEKIKNDITEIEYNIQVAKDEQKRKQQEEKAKKLLEFQDKIKRAEKEVNIAKSEFKKRNNQTKEAQDQANASDDLEDKIEILDKKKKEYKAAIKYKDSLKQRLDIINNNSALVKEYDDLEVHIDKITNDIERLTNDVDTAKKIYKEQFDKDKNLSSISPNCDFSQYQSISPESSVFTLASFIYQNINFKCGNACNTTDHGFNLCLKIKKSEICNDCIQVYIGPHSEFKSIKELFDSSEVKKGRKDPILVTESAVKNIEFKVELNDKTSCLKVRTSYGDIPIVCKNISSDNTDSISQISKNNRICSLSTTKSKVPFNFSGRAIGCLKEALDKMFYADSVTSDQVSSASILKPLSSFQQGMKVTVKAALILYIIFFGIKMIFIERFFSAEKLVTGVLKILLVTYFSVGFGPMTLKDGKINYNNGMQDHFLPFLSSVTSELAHMIFSSVGSDSSVGGTKLCYFDPDKDYTPDARYYALWDAIDCRIGYYLGFRLLHDYTVDRAKPSSGGQLVGGSAGTSANSEIAKHLSNIKNDHALKKDDTFLVFPTLWGLLLSGEIIFFVVMLLFVIIFLTLFWRFMAVFITSLVNLYVMCYISPVFIPMVLFEKTKSMFNNWLHLTLSFALQPAIVAAFIAIFITLMDSVTYKTCQFARYDYQQGNKNLSTFELRVPNSFTNENSIFADSYSSDAAKICRESAGYRLVEYFNGKNWHERIFIFFRAFVVYPEPDFLPTMLVILLFCGIFYYFFQEAHRFAAVITSGITAVNMELPSFKMPFLSNSAKAKKAAKEAEATDKFSSRGGGEEKAAADKFSNRPNIELLAQDKISTKLKDDTSLIKPKINNDAIEAAKEFYVGTDKFSTGSQKSDKTTDIKTRINNITSAEDKFNISSQPKDYKNVVQSAIDKKLASNLSNNNTANNQKMEIRNSNIASDDLSTKTNADSLMEELNKASDDKKNT